ncbi:MAG: flagellar protein FlgN [Lachnospiraceae bacterium]|nr:flagellar protein FlgN [Lachnospiraceae bacterium]
MATLIETLIQVLDEECKVFDELLEVSQAKTQAIVANDIEKLQKVTDKEQDVLTTVTALEKKREEATTDIATVLGKDAKNSTLKDIISYLNGQAETKNRLAEVHDRLLDRVTRLSAENQHNAVLVKDQLDLIEFSLNAIRGANQAPETGSYNKGAYNTGETYAPVKGTFDSSS